ncbi:MAG: glucuronate isomerase [Clostridia bacterium]|nr:glucuronate isomerase [Clostridia bacterium]
MKSIITDDFLLKNPTARHLFHDVAKSLPIIDYHCHLSPELIAKNHVFSDVGELMLAGDHYKWRAIRSFGVAEEQITGGADWREKFRAFATALPYCIGNPLYHWTHLELKRYFDVDEALSADNADEIFDRCSAKMAEGDFSARGLIERSGVEVVCTTDDPLDDLRWHQKIKADGWRVRVLPTFRPDKALNIHKDTFLPYLKQAGVTTYGELLAWLTARVAYFHENGCRLADHGLDFIPFGTGSAEAVFDKVMGGGTATLEETNVFMTAVMLHLAGLYTAHGWCMQIHVGALRNNNTRMFRALGPDTGYDSIAETSVAEPLSRLLDTLETNGALPKTILYSLNPKDNYTLATLMGCFQSDTCRGKLQLGSGWWFNDQRDGMEAQLKALGNLGVLGTFVGMLTDSRSFISYPRHEYFRRILCNLIGEWVEGGEYPADEPMLRSIIEAICYKNAKAYFCF